MSPASRPSLAASGKQEGDRKRRQTSVCVLPFQNMSGDPEQEYFSDGISEDITTDLSKVSALEVIARNTAFTFKGQAVDVCDVARKLGVSHVLEGSVRKAGDRVRVTAQLIDGASGGHVWADRYDRDLTDIFAIQDEISKAIVDALKVKLLPAGEEGDREPRHDQRRCLQPLPDGAAVLDHGRLRRPPPRGARHQAVQTAVEIDPDYAQAWALIGLAQANLYYAYSGNEELDDGLAAAEHALALDPNIAEAHLPMAWPSALHGKIEEADAEIVTALQSQPRLLGSQQGSGSDLLSPRQYRRGHPTSRTCDGACRIRFPQSRDAHRLLSRQRRPRPRP